LACWASSYVAARATLQHDSPCFSIRRSRPHAGDSLIELDFRLTLGEGIPVVLASTGGGEVTLIVGAASDLTGRAKAGSTQPAKLPMAPAAVAQWSRSPKTGGTPKQPKLAFNKRPPPFL
jgi:hypothetical protein